MARFSGILLSVFWVVFPFFYRQKDILHYQTATCALVLAAVVLIVLRVVELRTYRWHWGDVLMIAIGTWCAVDCIGPTEGTLTVDCTDLLGLFLLYAAIRLTGVTRTTWYAILLAGVLQVFTGGHYFSNNGPYGGYLALSAIAATGLFIEAKKKRERCILWMALVILLVGVVLSNSRAAWLALLIGGGNICWAHRHQLWGNTTRRVSLWRWWTVPLAVAILTGATALYAYKPASAEGRLLIWRTGLSLWTHSPYSGLGAGGFERGYMIEQAAWFRAHPQDPAMLLADNNWYAFQEGIHLLCNWGLIGGILVGALLIYLWTKCRKQHKTVTGMAIGILVFSCFSYPASVLTLSVFYFFLAACLVNRADDGKKKVWIMNWKLRVVTVIFLLTMGGKVAWETVQDYRSEQVLRQVMKGKEKPEKVWEHYPRMRTKPHFVLAWGKWCYNRQRYTEAIKILTDAVHLRPTEDMLTDLGICYQQTGRLAEAERCFLEAMHMLPARIMARYRLFCLYRDQGKQEKAREYALKIIDQPVKIVNSVTLEVKREVREYLKSQPIHP